MSSYGVEIEIFEILILKSHEIFLAKFNFFIYVARQIENKHQQNPTKSNTESLSSEIFQEWPICLQLCSASSCVVHQSRDLKHQHYSCLNGDRKQGSVK